MSQLSLRSRLVRKIVPDVRVTVELAPDLRLALSAKRHLGLLRPSTRRAEVAIAEKLAGHVPRSAVIYDIGANIGLYSLVFARDAARRVHAFEPGSVAAHYLRLNVALNALANVDVHQVLVSDRTGTCRFVHDPVTTATSHVAGAGEEGVEVPCVDLDSYVAGKRLPPPDLVKIDVEGHDESVLQGMERLLDRQPIVFIEGAQRQANGASGSIERLARRGYEIWDLHANRRLEDRTTAYAMVALPRTGAGASGHA
jgi:FkbM family methyltransferase